MWKIVAQKGEKNLWFSVNIDGMDFVFLKIYERKYVPRGKISFAPGKTQNSIGGNNFSSDKKKKKYFCKN